MSPLTALYPLLTGPTASGALGALPLADRDGRWLGNSVVTSGYLLDATSSTLLMTFLSGFFSVLIGLPLGLALVTTGPRGLHPNRFLNQLLSAVVNVGRSLPFIILLVAIMPFTKLIMHTTLGWQGVVVPLTVGAIPFYARLTESAVGGVEHGKFEAALMMGASGRQVTWGVLVREALPALIQGGTVTLITLIGYSAMAGVVGGGGLGDLAIRYGYQRYMTDVMVMTVVLIVLIVAVIQLVGDMLSRLVDHR